MRSLYDSTDFANDAMENLAANLNQLEFPSVSSLIAFLAQVAEQKVIDEYRRQHTLKRDVTRDRPIFGYGPMRLPVQLSSDDPSASQLAQANEVHERLLISFRQDGTRDHRPETTGIFDVGHRRADRLEHSQGAAFPPEPPRFADGVRRLNMKSRLASVRAARRTRPREPRRAIARG